MNASLRKAKQALSTFRLPSEFYEVIELDEIENGDSIQVSYRGHFQRFFKDIENVAFEILERILIWKKLKFRLIIIRNIPIYFRLLNSLWIGEHNLSEALLLMAFKFSLICNFFPDISQENCGNEILFSICEYSAQEICLLYLIEASVSYKGWINSGDHMKTSIAHIHSRIFFSNY